MFVKSGFAVAQVCDTATNTIARVARNPALITPECDGDFQMKHFAGTRNAFGDREAEFGLHSLR